MGKMMILMMSLAVLAGSMMSANACNTKPIDRAVETVVDSVQKVIDDATRTLRTMWQSAYNLIKNGIRSSVDWINQMAKNMVKNKKELSVCLCVYVSMCVLDD